MNKDQMKIKNLSEEEGSVQNAIVNWWKNYDFFDKSIDDILNDIKEIIPQDKINNVEVQDLLAKIQKINDTEKAAIIIGNFVLRGDHQAQLNGYREVGRKFLKNFGRKR